MLPESFAGSGPLKASLWQKGEAPELCIGWESLAQYLAHQDKKETEAWSQIFPAFSSAPVCQEASL